MFRTYVKLGEKDIDQEFLEKAGIQQKPAELIDTLKARPCSNCHFLNAPTSSYRYKCGYPVTEEARYETESLGDTIRQVIREKPELQRVFMDLFKDGNTKKAPV